MSLSTVKEKKKIYIKTYGCQMNMYDSLRIADLMDPLGYTIHPTIENADIVVLNTCHIREKAAEKVYSELGRIKALKEKNHKDGKTMLIAVAGCVAQAEGEEITKRAPYVDIVVGPQSYQNLPDLVGKIHRHQGHIIALDFEENKFDKLPTQSSQQSSSAFLSIQEGCDKFCTFCVVPYTRGAEYSRNVFDIYQEAMALAQNGAKELILLGQNVNAFHGNGPDNKSWNLGQLIRKIATIPAIERIRYTTSHPADMHHDLYQAHHEEEKLMPFLNLPIQSGSNKILQRMNRKYSREDYLEIIGQLRELRPDIEFSTDIIVGFPGETEKDFLDTLDLVKKVQFCQAYSFKYSARPGTPGAEFKNQVPEEEKDQRLHILQNLLQKQQIEFNQSCIGKTLPVLFNKEGKHNGQVIGKTPYMQSVFVNNPDVKDTITSIHINHATINSLTGTIKQTTHAGL